MSSEFNKALYDVVSERIVKITWEQPDLFTPAFIAKLISEAVITGILAGKTLGYLKPNEDDTELEFIPIFTHEQLHFIRTGLGGPFSGLIEQETKLAHEVTSFTIKVEDLGEPIEKKTLFESGKVKMTSTTYNI